MTPIDQLKSETVALFEKQYGHQELEEILDTFLMVIENHGGRIGFAPSPLPGPAKVVQVEMAVSSEKAGR